MPTKFVWTPELHELYMSAVDKLGGRDFIPPKPAVNHVGPTPAALKLVGCFRDEIRFNLHGVAGEPALVRVNETDSLGQ